MERAPKSASCPPKPPGHRPDPPMRRFLGDSFVCAIDRKRYKAEAARWDPRYPKRRTLICEHCADWIQRIADPVGDGRGRRIQWIQPTFEMDLDPQVSAPKVSGRRKSKDK
jgi:hypothetical protein